MIYDRQYMRESDGSRREISALAWIIGILIAAFVAQNVVATMAGGEAFIRQYLTLSRRLADGYVWTLVTYGFLHGDLLHILLNVLGLYLLGRTLLPIMGAERFIGYMLGATVLGGLTWFAVEMAFPHGSSVLGVSAAVCGLVTIFGTLYAEQRIGFLLIPVTVKAKYAALGLAGISIVLMAAFEIPGNSRSGSVAHSAHLGGMLAGWLYARFVHDRTGEFMLRPAIELPAWMSRRKRPKVREMPAFTVNVTPPPQDLRAEVDRILDKINSDGFGALTEEERRVLDDARDLLNKR
jgi:membrane associated rhomboid family serine protease